MRPPGKRTLCWNSLLDGDIITSTVFAEKAGVDVKAASSFLCSMVRIGKARRTGTKSGPFVRFQKGTHAREIVPRRKDELSTAEVGEAILKVVDDLRSALQGARADLKRAVEENRRLKQLHNQSQEKVIELSRKLNGLKTRSVSLSDLQKVVDNP